MPESDNQPSTVNFCISARLYIGTHVIAIVDTVGTDATPHTVFVV